MTALRRVGENAAAFVVYSGDSTRTSKETMTMTTNHNASRRTRRRMLAAVGAPALLCALALPGVADAGTVGMTQTETGPVLSYVPTGTQSGPSDLTFKMVNGDIAVTDASGITAGVGCRVVNATAFCDDDVAAVGITGTRGDDRLEYRLPHPGSANLLEGNDGVFGGVREATPDKRILPFAYFGGPGSNVVEFARATSGVRIDTGDSQPTDGRPNIDRENYNPEFGRIHGTLFDDVLFGTANADIIEGRGGNDDIAGGGGDDVFLSHLRDGTDTIHGGPGRDWMYYATRTADLSVSLDNVPNDGEAGEHDNVQANVENVFGGSGNDTMQSLNAVSELQGGAGNDRLFGGAAADTLDGGLGNDLLDGGAGNDVIQARDGAQDELDCGTEADIANRDVQERRVERNCESGFIGVVKMQRKAITADAGKQTRVGLSWQHPKSWKRLQKVTLRVRDAQGIAVGEVSLDPHSRRVSDSGLLTGLRSGTTLKRRGKLVSTSLGLKIDDRLAGQKLVAEIEATERGGRRQIARRVATITVSK